MMRVVSIVLVPLLGLGTDQVTKAIHVDQNIKAWHVDEFRGQHGKDLRHRLNILGNLDNEEVKRYLEDMSHGPRVQG